MGNEKINIGLFGFGCVGQGLYDVLQYSQGLRAEIKKICVKHREKKRKIDLSYFTFDKNDMFKNGDYNYIVELIDDAEAALDIVNTSLLTKKSVITANKKMIAENFEQLYKLQLETGNSILYEGACGGSIPIIRTLEEYYDNELLKSVRGILNGSSNFILTKMEHENLTYKSAVEETKKLGFAESNPWLDVAGYDTKYKLCILAAHAFGIILKPDSVINLGIQNVTPFDIKYTSEKKLRIKLLAHAEKTGEKYKVFVLPHFISRENPLGSINYEQNGVEVEGVFSDKQFFGGKGAGSHPTGSAVLSDISAITYDYKYGYKKLKKRVNGAIPDYSNDEQYIDNNFLIKLYIRFEDKNELNKLEIDSVEEEYSSKNNSYVVANVRFSSLKNIEDSKTLFVCVV